MNAPGRAPALRLPDLASAEGVALAGMALWLAHGLASMAGGNEALALDDVKLNVFTQSLQGGYLPGNPPLFEWLLLGAQAVVGPKAASFLVVRVALLTSAMIFTFLAAREASLRPLYAAMAASFIPLTYQAGWNHPALTHSLALLAATAALWWTLMRVRRTGALVDYALAGAAIGAGLVSKYSFFAVLASAFAAIALDARGRARLARPGAALAMATAFVVASPHIIWLIDRGAEGIAAAAAQLTAADMSHWRRAMTGIPAAAWSIGSFFLPVGVIAAVAFPAAFRPSQHAPREAQVFGAAAAVAIVGVFVGVMVIGIASLHERYAIGLVFPGLLWLAARIEASAPDSARIRLFAIAALFSVAVMLGARLVAAVHPGPPFCNSCRQLTPFDALARTLRTPEWKDATLVGYDDATAGNLRRLFPQNRILSAHQPFYTPPRKELTGNMGEETCLFIWSDQLAPPPPARITDPAPGIDRVVVNARWRVRPGVGDWRLTRWTVIDVTGARDLAAELCRHPAKGEAQ